MNHSTSLVCQLLRCLEVEVANIFSAYGTDVGIGGLPLFNVNGN